nr:nucleotide-binding alpha-beta plait domain-containing protein [Tanacetum cinerariifolium]
MANGFIPSQGDVILYVLGEEFFSCLVRRSFFQDVVEVDIYTDEQCKMHDLMHDLTQSVMGQDCAVIEPGKELITPTEVLHLSLECEDFVFSKQDLKKLRSLRSMLVFNEGELGNLNLLGWDLRLSELENVRGLTDAKSANLKDKTNLKYFRLGSSWDRSEETCDSDVVERSEPNSVNLTSIVLIDIKKCEELPQLGKLSSLKRIDLELMMSLKCFHNEDDAASKDEIHIPNLQELRISGCPSLVIMAKYRSKEDDVNHISISIFVMNFLESFSAKDLFHTCKQYGHVVDSFIQSKRTKEARFQRKPLNEMSTSAKTMGENNRGGDKSSRSFGGAMGNGNSYINVLKSKLPYSLMGRVKEFALLTNLKTALLNKGFADLSVRYLGELWVLLEFSSSKTKEAFRVNVRVSSWFSEIRQASLDIIPDGRIVWVEVEGVPLKLWSMNTFRRIAIKWGDLIDVDDIDESYFHSKRLWLYTKSSLNIYENFKIIFKGKVFWIHAKEMNEDDLCEDNMDMADVPETIFDESNGQKKDVSQDPFGIYPMHNKKTNEKNDKDHSPKYPPGFTPNEKTNVNSGIGINSLTTMRMRGRLGEMEFLLMLILKVMMLIL